MREFKILTDNTADLPESYIRERCGGREETYEKSIQKDGSIVFDVYFSGMHQRYTFSEI